MTYLLPLELSVLSEDLVRETSLLLMEGVDLQADNPPVEAMAEDTGTKEEACLAEEPGSESKESRSVDPVE